MCERERQAITEKRNNYLKKELDARPYVLDFYFPLFRGLIEYERMSESVFVPRALRRVAYASICVQWCAFCVHYARSPSL